MLLVLVLRGCGGHRAEPSFDAVLALVVLLRCVYSLDFSLQGPAAAFVASVKRVTTAALRGKVSSRRQSRHPLVLPSKLLIQVSQLEPTIRWKNINRILRSPLV